MTPRKSDEQTPVAPGPALSIVLPVYNEAENLPRLHQSILEGVSPLGQSYEILYVDDGSRDAGPQILRELAAADPHVRVLFFKTNFGQTAAISAGIDHARGRVIVTLDADLQNDPHDIPMLVRKLDEGHDVVSGWRRDRQDAKLSRTIPSNVANWLISRVTGLPLHDYGCTLKAYRREVFEEIQLYGEMHRFIPAYAYWAGARVTEVVVRHHRRVAGASKYGLTRTVKVLLDLMTMTFLHSYSTKPIYVFGGFGGVSLGLAGMGGLFVILRRLFMAGDWMSPLILVASVLFIAGIQFILMGLLAEILVRTYHESQGKPTYALREIVGGGPASEPAA
ncbi:MAG: glycosyltransferase family 2 protein [Candidatus Wallbacteria bacterium]|nr:glycosyltransferase family 2 protein [Candidatus Wallbacteria bacterium]